MSSLDARAGDLTAPPADSFEALVAGFEAAGVRVDTAEAREWLAEVANAAATPHEFEIHRELDLGGHELAMLDFDPAAAERLRRIGALIAIQAVDGVRTALAISGSAAQGQIQPFPADFDFFERVHITQLGAPTIEAARRRLAELVRANVAEVQRVPAFNLEEVYFGIRPGKAGGCVSWTLAEIVAGEKAIDSGEPLTWAAAASDPGFVKLDWVLADPGFGAPCKVCKAIDATWESPDGSALSLDGLIDADYQHVYLAAGAAEFAAELTHGATLADRAEYLRQLEARVREALASSPANYVKLAKRLYNICRLSGRYREALFIRELFDEPPSRLHQLHAALELSIERVDRDSTAACDDLRRMLQDAAPAMAGWPECAAAVDIVLAALQQPASAALRDALASLHNIAAELANREFKARLTAYAPVAELITEIETRGDTELGGSSYAIRPYGVKNR